MFTMDVVSLRQFYHSPLGVQAARYIRAAYLRLWPKLGSDRLVGIGYGLPLLEGVAREDDVIDLMLARQGAIFWPAESPNRVALIDEQALPLRAEVANRVLVMHTLEHARHIGTALEEIWRILVPGGRALLIVPNRRGIWSQAAETPFGCGQPFSIGQLAKRAQDKGFTLARCHTALYLLPLSWRWTHKTAPVIEWVGRTFFPGVGGVILMEVEKQIYAAIPEPAKPAFSDVLAQAGSPAMT